MSTEPILTEPQLLILHFGSVMQKINDHEFFEFCRLNPDWRIERTSVGDLVIMPPSGGRTGKRNFTLIGLLGAWVEADGTGIGFDSSTGFALPNGAKRSPDLAWVERSRWEALMEEEQEIFREVYPRILHFVRGQAS